MLDCGVTGAANKVEQKVDSQADPSQMGLVFDDDELNYLNFWQ